MAHHHEVDCLVKRLDCSGVVKVTEKEKFRILVNVHLNDISSAAEPSVTKLGMVMHHYEPDSLSKRLLCFLQCQGHNEGSYNQNMTF